MGTAPGFPTALPNLLGGLWDLRESPVPVSSSPLGTLRPPPSTETLRPSLGAQVAVPCGGSEALGVRLRSAAQTQKRDK